MPGIVLGVGVTTGSVGDTVLLVHQHVFPSKFFKALTSPPEHPTSQEKLAHPPLHGRARLSHGSPQRRVQEWAEDIQWVLPGDTWDGSSSSSWGLQKGAVFFR